MLEPEHRNQKGTQIIKVFAKVTITGIATFQFVNVLVNLYHFASLYFQILKKSEAKFENKKLIKAFAKKLM